MKNNWLDAQSFPSSTLFTWMTELEAGVSPTQICQITSSGPKKIDLIIGVIEICVSNGDNGFHITLKDPTGVVRATMHHTAVWQ
ncbi:unnamed protein product [Rhodiola kirilowii]